MPNPGYRSAWHGWGTMMPGVLADAGRLLHRQDWIDTAATSLSRFAPHVLIQGGPDNFWAPTPVSRVQFGFSVDDLVQNLYKVGTAAHSRGLLDLAGMAASWYFGNNYGNAQMYDPSTGRLYDGIDGDGNVNLNAGAETAHAVMSMELLDAHPELARRALAATQIGRHTWRMTEAENGALAGDATLSDPCTFVVAEGWCSGREVILGPGGTDTLTVDLPKPGRYLLMVAAQRQQAPTGVVGASISVDGAPVDTIDLGGAGPQGVTPQPGYPDLVTIQQPVTFDGDQSQVELRYAGQAGHTIEVDGVFLEPVVESEVLGSADGSQAVLRSFSADAESEPVQLAGAGLTVAVYDQHGRLRDTIHVTGNSVDAPVAPGGFTVVTSRGLSATTREGS
jgi:hypothetical protein